MANMGLRPALLLAMAALGATLAAPARADEDHAGSLAPGNLLVSRSVYGGSSSLLTPGATILAPGCLSACVFANTDGAYPFVFNNDTVDASFGITSKIFLDQMTPWGWRINTLEVPNSAERHVSAQEDQMVTSFPSKSELALNLSLSGRRVTFMGYLAPVNAIDVSNSNTPAVFDPTNPVPGSNYRVVASLNRHGRFHFTLTNAYSGNNGRAAILNDETGANVMYTAGNAGNGGNPQPDGVITGAGAQILTPAHAPEAAQIPGAPTPVASFNITQLGDKADKIGKDTNFRGMTVSGNVLYFTKGSGSNGVNTVYFVDTTGAACPNGVGLPQPGAALPTSRLAFNPAVLQTQGLQPNNMCILKGFPTALKSKTAFPFGLWFANDHTLYLADEGDGDNTYSTSSGTYTKAGTSTTAGLQKWMLDDSTQTWKLAYTIQSGLKLGQPYTIPGYPTGNNAITGLPWAPATDGLRNLTGRVNRDGTVTIWAITSTVSGGGDQGADPNKLVAVSDPISATTLPGADSFLTVRSAGYGEVLRGVSLTPGTGVSGRPWSRFGRARRGSRARG